jgi:hypothetical protein
MTLPKAFIQAVDLADLERQLSDTAFRSAAEER